MSDRPQPPRGLSRPGRGLWERICNDLPSELEFDSRDLVLLFRAAKALDRLVALDAAVAREGVMSETEDGNSRLHPALSEMRLTEVTLHKLLSGIDLGSGTTAAQHASRAAQARWSKAGPSRRQPNRRVSA